MKNIIRSFVFSYIALYFTQLYIGAITFGGDPIRSTAILVTGLALLNILIIPALSILGIKAKGLTFPAVHFVLTALLLYFVAPAIPGLTITGTYLPSLHILGFMLPSKHLDKTGSLVFSALLTSLVYGFLTWLSAKKK